MRIHTKILRQIAQDIAQSVRRLRDIHAIPKHASLRRPRNGRKNTHQRGLSGAVRTEQSDYAGHELESHVAQTPSLSAVTLTHPFNRKIHRIPGASPCADLSTPESNSLDERSGQKVPARRPEHGPGRLAFLVYRPNARHTLRAFYQKWSESNVSTASENIFGSDFSRTAGAARNSGVAARA